jgi:copper resistance protein C
MNVAIFPRPTKCGALLLTALMATLCLGSPASAHNAVEELIPAPETTVTTSPLTVSLATDDLFLDLGENTGAFGIVMVDQEGLFYGDGCVSVIESRMIATIALGLSGTYQVVYQFVSADGHSLSGSYTVSFEPGQSHLPTTGLTEAPVCGASYPDANTPVSPAPEISETATPPALANPMNDGRPNIPPWAFVAGPLLVLAIAGFGWYRGRKKAAR